MRKFLLSLIIISLCNVSGFAQDFSNKGKEFWLVFPAHTPSSGQAQMGLFITSDRNSSGTISVNGFNTTFTVLANQVTGPIDIPYANANIGTTTAVVNKGIHVSVNPGQPAVVLYAHIYAGFRSEASLILPVATLGKSYFSTNFFQASTGGSQSQFNVVATEANTVVQYQLRTNGNLSPTINTVNLPNPGDQFQVQNGQDLSGSIIQSIASGSGGCKRIAVFSGSSALAISRQGCNGNSYDPLFQQCYPVSTWGKSFGIVPFLNNNNGYHLRIMASENNTTVNFNGTTITLNAGQYYPASINNPVPFTAPMTISADKPISASQYMMSGGCAGSANFPGQTNAQGDPDMIILNPVEQNISDINIFSSDLQNIRTKYLNVYMKTAGSSTFRINGALPTAAFVPMPQNNGYSYLRENISNYPLNSFRLKADSGFNAITYGMGDAESYGYSAGTNVKDLYQQISVSSQYGIETSPSVCSGSPFKFKISLPYKPLQLAWDLSGLPPTTTPNFANVLQNPTPGCTIFPLPADNNQYVCPDSIRMVNGKEIYWYSLPTTYSINTTGTFPVTIIAQTNGSDGCGSEQEISFELEVSTPPVADFTFTIPNCAAEAVQFSDNTITVKPNYSWYWSFGDPGSGAANTSNLQNPVHTFSTPGPHTVRFASITTPGCLSDTLEKIVTVPAQPTATISGGTIICIGAPQPTVNFIATGGTEPYTFTFNINGGAAQTISTTGSALTATLQAPTTAAGTFVYTLTNIAGAGPALCSTPITGQSTTVTVNALPTATISGTAVVCQNSAPANITFTGTGGVAPYTFNYTIDGVVQPPLTTTAPSGSITIPAPTGVPATFTYVLTGVSDGSATGCPNIASGSAVVTVSTLPVASAGGDAEVCQGTASPVVTFTGNGGTAPFTFTYNINNGATQTIVSTGNTATISAPTATAGTFVYKILSIRESSSVSCLNNAVNPIVTIIVNPKPTASFTAAAPFCESKDVLFTPAFTISGGTITSWVWDYGDGTGSHVRPNGAPFTVNYTTAGPKVVTFKTVSDKGCESILFSQTITINAKPLAGFILPEVCLLDPFAQFTDTSKVTAPGSITAWQWNFGDPNATGANPNISAAQNPTHVYTVVGTYNVELIATSNFGCKDTVLQALTISAGNPASNFIVINPAGLCSSDSVAIQNKSIIGSGNITKLEICWNFAGAPTVFDTDDFPVFDKIYKHKYPTLATDQNYTIRVRAYSGGVCFSNRDIVVTVHATPVVQLNAISDVCLNNGTVQFTQGSETAGVPGTGVYSGSGVNASGLFDPITAGVGTHVITYTYTSSFGCAQFRTTNVNVLDAPVADFTAVTPSCQNSAVTFTQSSVPTVGIITQWIYNWGDATPSQTFTDGGPRTHTYTVAQSYTATLTVVTDGGCRSLPESITFTVNPQPQPNFTFTPSACLPQAVISFQNTTPNISDWAYSWNFDLPSTAPGDQSTQINPSHTYTSFGVHNVQLTATSGTTGCTNVVVKDISSSLHAAPVAAFNFNKNAICANQTVQVTDASSPTEGTLNSWSWNYGDNSTGTGQTQPPHLYTSPATFNVKLTVTNSFGCSDDSTRPFTVYAYPDANAGNDLFVLEGGSVVIGATATGNNLTYLWTPPTGLSSATVLQPVAKPLVDITYKLLVTAQGGCSDSDAVFIKVLKFPVIPNTFTPNNDGIHDFWEIKYLFTYPGNRVQVFTRTGELVFESRGYTKPWDGTKNGKSLPFDTYYYVIEPGSGREPVKGFVTIIK